MLFEHFSSKKMVAFLILESTRCLVGCLVIFMQQTWIYQPIFISAVMLSCILTSFSQSLMYHQCQKRPLTKDITFIWHLRLICCCFVTAILHSWRITARDAKWLEWYFSFTYLCLLSSLSCGCCISLNVFTEVELLDNRHILKLKSTTHCYRSIFNV